jgi:FdhD protein
MATVEPEPPRPGADRLGADLGLGYAAPQRRRTWLRLEGGRAGPAEGSLAEEVPAALVYAGRSHAVMMCTPADLEDLAVGFTLTEGVVARAAEIGPVRVARHSRGVELEVEVPPAAAERLQARGRAIAGRTGCGLCGVEAIDDAVRAPRRVTSELHIGQVALWRAAAALEAHQPLNAETRAVHAAAWCEADGTLRVVREDVGRHNAMDKALGSQLLAGRYPLPGVVACLSGRASFELVQKAALAGLAGIVAVGAPSSLAVELARERGMLLCGFARGDSFNVYSGTLQM